MQQTFDTPQPVALRVELGSGTLSLVADDVTTTVVDVQGRDADDVTIAQRGDEIVVLAPRRTGGFVGGNGHLDVHVTLPADSGLTAKLGSADLRARGRLGDLAVKTGSGDIELQLVAGEALLESGSGDVQIGEAAGTLQVKTGSGEVTVDRLRAAGTLSTGSGDLTVGVSDDAVSLKAGSGDAHVVEAFGDCVLSTASGDITVERVHRGQVRATNVSGDISVGVPGGVPVWTDVSTVTGSVTSSLIGAGEPAEGQDYVELHAKTVSGDVRLQQR